MQGDFIYMLTYFGTFGLQACVNLLGEGGGDGGLEVSDTSNQESSLALTKSTWLTHCKRIYLITYKTKNGICCVLNSSCGRADTVVTFLFNACT